LSERGEANDAGYGFDERGFGESGGLVLVA